MCANANLWPMARTRSELDPAAPHSTSFAYPPRLRGDTAHTCTRALCTPCTHDPASQRPGPIHAGRLVLMGHRTFLRAC
eukprot:4067730-Prymnesium_polylepis.1